MLSTKRTTAVCSDGVSPEQNCCGFFLVHRYAQAFQCLKQMPEKLLEYCSRYLSSDHYNYLYAAVNSLAELLTVSRTSYDCSVVDRYRVLRTDSVSELRSL